MNILYKSLLFRGFLIENIIFSVIVKRSKRNYYNIMDQLAELFTKQTYQEDGITQGQVISLAKHHKKTHSQIILSLSKIEGLNLIESVDSFAKRKINTRNQEGYLFKDGSVLVKSNGTFVAFTIDESSLWLRGLGTQPFDLAAVYAGAAFTLRSGVSFSVVEIDIAKNLPLTIKLDNDQSIIVYKNDGKSDNYQFSAYDLLLVTQTDSIFPAAGGNKRNTNILSMLLK
jgi:hypothetical protein